MNIGRSLRWWRKKTGFKQADIAEKLQISRQAYSNYENGKREPNINLICGMAQVFEITTDEFFKKAMEK